MKHISYKQNLGLVLQQMRKKSGYSQEAYADLFGINRTYYGKVERGENSISIDKLQQIAENLKIPLSELIKKAERPEIT